MLTFTSSNSVAIALLGLLVVALAWLAVLTIMIWGAKAARKRLGVAVKNETEIFDVIHNLAEGIDRLADKQERLALAGKQNRALAAESIRHVAVVRFDAFPEVGGRMSFAAALLDEGGNGLVVSSINGRSDGRVYAKPIIGSRSEFPLSEEEEEAIRQAFESVKARS
jgi:hypothetical protein